jgi:HTH-type transcriptional regulator / antitoxin HigA
MSATYQELLLEVLPEAIETEAQYEAATRHLSELLRKQKLTAGEAKLESLLAALVRDYDQRHAMPSDDSTPAEMLEFLLEHSGKTRKDLEAIFGTRSHVSEALNGKRSISAEQARKLGVMFRVKPGLFI